MYTLNLLYALAPLVAGLCFDNFMHMQGEICNVRQPLQVVIQYDRQDPKDACFKDGIFYPRCKDLDNPEVWRYHQLFKNL